ncbi:MAG TPA: hypothetical protein VGI90_17520 [Steroidobacteraceae bacterium]|jgi:hypothetical protein
MTAVAYRLLRGYLVRSAWLYLPFSLVHLALTLLYAVRGISRVTVPGALLALLGLAALNGQSLVWRSVPLRARDASVFRWWAIAGVPGLFVTACDAMAWASQLTPARLPPAAVYSLLESILVGWAAVGVIAALAAIREKIDLGFRAGIAMGFLLIIALVYGVPKYSASPGVSIAFMVIGLSSLVFSGIEAARGQLWRWPEPVKPKSPGRRRMLSMPRPRFGISVIALPLLLRTGLVALVATGGFVFLHRVFSGAADWLLWAYFISVSTIGFTLTYQIRSAIRTLRALPLSSAQLAGMLLFFGALPGIVTLGMTLLLNRIWLHVTLLDPVEFSTFALIIIASQALPLPARPAPPVGVLFGKWIPLFQRIALPAYLGFVVLHEAGAFAAFWWFKWPLIAAGIGLCIVCFYSSVRHVRSGVRPLSNDEVFSPRLSIR